MKTFEELKHFISIDEAVPAGDYTVAVTGVVKPNGNIKITKVETVNGL